MDIFLIILGVVILSIVLIYNNLVRLKNLVNSSFSSIDIMLKRRYDIIPNLVETVKAYMNYEETVLNDITNLRVKALDNKVSINEKIKLDKDISQDVKKILALSETYPNLKANENFLQLQKAIIDAEDELAAARRAFNASATEYNINIKVFPNSIFANMFNFKEVNLFETKDKSNIKIDLG